MIEILRFTFESFGHFVGVCFLICLCGFWLGVIVTPLGNIGRPQKHVVTTYESTHKM